ncbi:glycosyltransferase [Micromonospora sp. DPT]|uniref:glycosyltransferase n=1 Tax=Micromonospora sp. DPT TaxID=3142975 RepID=UPI00320B006B
MRILQIVNDLSTGGAQTLVAEVSAALGKRHEMGLLVLAAPGPLSERLEATVGSVEYLDIPRSSWRVDELVSRVGEVTRAFRPNVAHSHLLHADFALALQNQSIPKVSTVHTSGFASADRVRSRILARVCARLAARFSVNVACSQSSWSYMEKLGYPMSSSVLIGNGVRVPHSPPPPSSDPSLLCLSRWHPMKDHSTLFEALKLVMQAGHRDVRLVCAGSGMEPDNEELVGLISSLGLTDIVELRGPVGDVTPLINQARALVISSSYGEALPMAGAEALAQGRAVVTTDVGSCSRLAVHPWLTVPRQSPGALAEAMGRVLELTPEEAADLCRDAFRLAQEEFDIDITARRYEELYHRLAEGATR